MSDMRLAVMGAAGRMGQTLTRAVHAAPGCVVAGGTEAPGSEAIGKDVGELAGLGPLEWRAPCSNRHASGKAVAARTRLRSFDARSG